MRLALTALIFMIGLFDLFVAASFLFNPLSIAQSLGVVPIAAAGISTLRADFTAFFGVAGAAMMWGAWRRNADLMLVPLLLFAVAFASRAFDLVITGAYPGWPAPMAVELVEVVLLLAGWRFLPHHRIAELTEGL
ncbi:hypothetical protein [Novosphingobium sp.]|uniref:hypothetical protein n=1 Tax=Novosphingobium sp. TaxID=1874826 RepID=UPI003B5268E7